MIFHGLEAGKRNQAVQTVLNVYPINRNMECNRKLVGWMDGWMDGWMHGWMDGWMDGWRDGGMEGWRDGGMEGWRDGGMEGWRDGGMDGGRDSERERGSRDGWMNGRMGWDGMGWDGTGWDGMGLMYGWNADEVPKASVALVGGTWTSSRRGLPDNLDLDTMRCPCYGRQKAKVYSSASCKLRLRPTVVVAAGALLPESSCQHRVLAVAAGCILTRNGPKPTPENSTRKQ